MVWTEGEFDAVARRALNRSKFIIAGGLQLVWAGPVMEETHWELFGDHALDRTQTRRKQTFRAWNISVSGAEEPLLALRLDLPANCVHVTRAILCHSHEARTSDNVVDTQEAVRWVRELFGSVPPGPDAESELMALLFQAVVGASRLPLISQEAPLPDFSLGRLGYFPELDISDIATKRLEFALRCGSALPDDPDPLRRLRAVFHGVSLSPYTDFVSNSLTYLRLSESRGVISLEQRLDFLTYLLRLQWRHLNAYDLFVFHHRGANYPDALMIDAVLREVASIVDVHPGLMAAPLRRRGYCLGWLLQAMYSGLMVPAQPTSPGEGQRVWPAPFDGVADIRSRQLFERPIPRPLMLNEVLREPDTLRELGTVLILDRPLGQAKPPGAWDRTPMLAHVARSRKRARQVLAILGMDIDISAIEFPGRPLPPLRRRPRLGIVSICDLTQDDFVIVRTTVASLTAFRSYFDWQGIAGDWHSIVPEASAAGEHLTVYDSSGTAWLEITPLLDNGFVLSRGIELPMDGLDAAVLQTGQKFTIRRQTSPAFPHAELV